MYPKITLSSDEAKRLIALNDKQASMQQVISIAQANWERRGSELVAEGRAIWKDIATAHGLDLEKVNYTLDSDGKALIPVSARLV
jgi:hypothetical protein